MPLLKCKTCQKFLARGRLVCKKCEDDKKGLTAKEDKLTRKRLQGIFQRLIDARNKK